MTSNIKILAGVLAVQLGLVTFFLMKKEPTAAFEATQNLLSIDFDKLDKIVIAPEKNDKTKDAKALTLVKTDAKWLLPEHFSFPCSETKTSDFLKAMKEMKKSWPLGKTMLAAKKYSVVDDKFERKIDFYTGDKIVASLYLGDSPGFRKVYARVDKEELTFGIKFNTFDVPVNAKQWVNKEYYEIPKPLAKEITAPGLTLIADNGKFLVKDLDANHETDTTNSGNLVSKLLSPHFDEVLGFKEKVDKGEKVLSYQVKTEKETVSFDFYRSKGGDSKAKQDDSKKTEKAAEDLVLEVSKYPYAFKILESKVKDLLTIDKTLYVKEKKAVNNDASTKKEAHAQPDLGDNQPEKKDESSGS